MGGPKPKSDTGEARKELIAFKVAPTEEDLIHDLLREVQLPAENVGVRDLLLKLARRELVIVEQPAGQAA